MIMNGVLPSISISRMPFHCRYVLLSGRSVGVSGAFTTPGDSGYATDQEQSRQCCSNHFLHHYGFPRFLRKINLSLGREMGVLLDMSN
jgi:hypothetical protein